MIKQKLVKDTEYYVKQQVKAEVGDSILTKAQYFMVLQKYGLLRKPSYSTTKYSTPRGDRGRLNYAK